MSHFTRIRTRMRDAGVLAAALAELGYQQAEVHDAPQVLFGYQGDARPERAEVVVRRQHIGALSNDIGFARQPDDSFDWIGLRSRSASDESCHCQAASSGHTVVTVFPVTTSSSTLTGRRSRRARVR